MSIWPIFLVIYELEPKLRCKSENLKHPFFRAPLQRIKNFEGWCNCQHFKIGKSYFNCRTF